MLLALAQTRRRQSPLRSQPVPCFAFFCCFGGWLMWLPRMRKGAERTRDRHASMRAQGRPLRSLARSGTHRLIRLALRTMLSMNLLQDRKAHQQLIWQARDRAAALTMLSAASCASKRDGTSQPTQRIHLARRGAAPEQNGEVAARAVALCAREALAEHVALQDARSA
jgi:hypothetical protein